MALRLAAGLGVTATAALALAIACAKPADTATPAPAPAPAAMNMPMPVPAAPSVSSALLGADSRVIAKDLPPLPDGLSTAPRPPEIVKAVYEFAARHPEVLKYIPCFCGCERMGHQGNDMCFVASRNAAGHVTSWEPHGMICEVCLDVGRDAMQMHNSGASTAEIRTLIEKKYKEPGRSETPTPLPPHRGGAAR